MKLNPKDINFDSRDLFDCLNKYYQKKYKSKIKDYNIFYDSRTNIVCFEINFKSGFVITFQYSYKLMLKKLKPHKNNATLDDFLFIYLRDLIFALKHN